ncbi:uncharacterized protein LOC134277475 [Saccostrea cucullata]|uniref:uncharacterized protein LOC134277475 n=1 Tax=Saccostrea cuccullata TaxID=36930 RepID=UPI002ED1BBF9
MESCSQLSQSSAVSNASTIPPEIVENEDEEFVNEINRVNDLYFGNLSNTSDVDPEYHSDNAESSDENESDGEIEDRENLVPIEQSEVDKNEIDQFQKFNSKTCGCSRLYGKPCSEVVDLESLLEYRNTCLEMNKEELDMMIKVQLFHHRRNDKVTSAKKHRSKERERIRQEYFFNGHQVCRETFAFCHGVYRKTVDALARSLDKDGLAPRIHGNIGKHPKHALTVNDVQSVKDFLTSYGNNFGLPLPGRLPNYRDCRAIVLPSDKTKADIHQDYLLAAESLHLRKICLSEFKRVWLNTCPHVLISKPSTDLCYKCQSYANILVHGGNMTEEEKEQHLEKYTAHVEKSKMQRDYYRRQCEVSKTSFSALPNERKTRGQPICSLEGTQHYSFDYAQQIHYPHYAQQVGPLFFKTPRKCQCFGICSEGSGSQIFYLIDESQHSGKGANSVASMIHHHFQHKGYGEMNLQLHMDNCTGQNKNNTVIGYGMWRVMTGRHMTIEFSLMEAGHTKFHPDWHFGLWKVKWRGTTAENLEEVAKSVAHSSRNNHNIPQLVEDPQYPVIFYDWSTFLKQYFKPIPQLKQYHHFRMTHEHPGVVHLRKYAGDEEITVNILKHKDFRFPNMDASLPTVIKACGLDAQRQWYLYDEVAPYCASHEACPRPSVPKPSAIKVEQKVKLGKRKCAN